MSTTAIGDQPRDPFNWPPMQRADLMSATGGLQGNRDLFRMKKENMVPKKRL